MKKRRIRIAPFFLVPILFVGVLAAFSASWYHSIFADAGFDSILYSLFSDMAGTEEGMLRSFFIHSALPSILATFLISFFLFADPPRSLMLAVGKKKMRLYPFPRFLSALLSLVLTLALIFTAADQVKMFEYLSYVSQEDSFIEENYADPKEVEILFPEEKRNLIILYLESMETSYFSQEEGGGNDVNVIPELYTLASENLNFSHNDGIGGFSSPTGSTWTMGAMVSQTTGLPLKVPYNLDPSGYTDENFLPGAKGLLDILDENGYSVSLMVGSDAAFAGRDAYYKRHGASQIYDYFSAREDEIIPWDYYVWWGMEDQHLFRYAKEELTKLSQKEEPFAFTMLTVDTHFVSGYVCEECETEYPEQYENVLRCSSKQVEEFVSWFREQDFYENTTLVITGDHPTMDAGYLANNIPESYDRKVYNCFINSAKEAKNTKNRNFSSFDIFPTTLSALGCTIEGDRLGLGTDLFSQTPTLCEEFGLEKMNENLTKRSEFYDKKILEIF